jgi:hypothetical protein
MNADSSSSDGEGGDNLMDSTEAPPAPIDENEAIASDSELNVQSSKEPENVVRDTAELSCLQGTNELIAAADSQPDGKIKRKRQSIQGKSLCCCSFAVV